ncbi:MAG: glutamyl-tRNA reductase, partial [Acidaminobacteraceae bacterium]
MVTALIGLNHETASLEIREKLSFSDSRKIEIISDVLDLGIAEVTVLSTCSRSEFYIADKVNDIDEKIDTLLVFLRKISAYEDIDKYLYIKRGSAVAVHLFNVTAGLDSIVLGEDQILGQVRDSQKFSMDIGGSKKILNKLFRDAITTAKLIKTELKISEHPLSLSYIGIKFLRANLGKLDDKKAMIVGYGKMGSLALEYLLSEGVRDITLVGRDLDKLKGLNGKKVNLKYLDYSERYKALTDVDMIISSTSASHFVLTKENMPLINRSISILDLALPRDVDPLISEIDGIDVYSIDDLKDVSMKSVEKRDKLAKEALVIIMEKALEFKEWLKSVKSYKLISSLNGYLESI